MSFRAISIDLQSHNPLFYRNSTFPIAITNCKNHPHTWAGVGTLLAQAPPGRVTGAVGGNAAGPQAAAKGAKQLHIPLTPFALTP